MLKRRILPAILVGGLLIAGGAVMRYLVSTRPAPPSRDIVRPPLVVRGVRLNPETVVEPIIAYGTARADRRAWLSAEVSGEVVELADGLEEGERFAAGSPLLRIDPREYEQQLQRARSLLEADRVALQQLDIEEKYLHRLSDIAMSELEIAQREYDRVRGLMESEAAGRRELDLARQAFEAARRTATDLQSRLEQLPPRRAAQQAAVALREAEVALADLNVERTTLRAPFDGRIEELRVEIGERVQPGSQLIAMLDPDEIEIPIQLPLSLRERVRVGAAAEIAIDSQPGVAWRGEVARIAPRADERTRTVPVYLEVDNTRQDPPLLPGSFVRAEIAGPLLRDVLVVPRAAVQDATVYLLQDGRAQPVSIDVRRTLVDRAVVSGLQPGDIVITSNYDALYPGAAVKLADSRVATSAPADGATPAAAAASDIPTVSTNGEGH